MAVTALHMVHQDIWPAIRELYLDQNEHSRQEGPTQDLEPRYWVWIWRHNTRTQEPHWKGLYVVILDPPPPALFEAVGLNNTFSVSLEKNPTQCNWGERKVGFTLQAVSGKGTCVESSHSQEKPLCHY